jgi:quercetin dioxygenase-like cupin family protein
MLQRLSTICMSVAAILAAQDPVQVSPDYKVEIDNKFVRVLRVNRAPHAKAPMHQHPASVVVYLTDYHQKITGADGKVREVTQKAGDVSYTDAVTHSEENSSDQPWEAVVIELKPTPADYKRPLITLDPVKLDPEHHLVPLENDRVRVLRTILEPHLKSPMHQHPHYVVVYLTELHTTMKLGNGKVIDNPRQPGEIAWRGALKHETENIGDRTATEIQVELK